MTNNDKQQFPLRLRQDWQNAYTGYEPKSEPLIRMSEQQADQFITAATKYLKWFETHASDELKTIANNLSKLNMNGKEHAILNFGQDTLHYLSPSLYQYVASEINVSDEELNQYAEKGERLGHSNSPADDLAIHHRYIQHQKELNSAGALNYFLTVREGPKFAQTALLHSIDGITEAIDALTPTSKVSLKSLCNLFNKDHRDTIHALQSIKSTMDETGLTEATQQIKSCVSSESEHERQHRESMQKTHWSDPHSCYR